MYPSSRTLLLVGLIVIGLIAYLVLYTGTSPDVPKADLTPPESSDVANDLRNGTTAELQSGSAHPDEHLPCVPLQEYLVGPDRYRLDAWFMSWGAPTTGAVPPSASAYHWYDEKTLLEMSRAGDVSATHERGRRLVIAALTGVRKPPVELTIWDVAFDSPELPLDQHFDSDKLNAGREILFEAAVLGRTYALIEISLSYTLERRALSAAGELDSESLDDFRVKSFAYGEAVERLVPELYSSFYQSSLPGELRPNAEHELNAITEHVRTARADLGVNLRPTDEDAAKILNSLRICRD